MIRPKLDHKYFTSETYWTKWNYLTSWDSNTMTNKDVIVNGITKNPSIISSYTQNQFADSTAEELTIIIDLAKGSAKEHLGFEGNRIVKILNIILLNYTDDNYPRNLTYLGGGINTVNLTAYDSKGHKVDKIKYRGYLITELTGCMVFNGPTLVIQDSVDALIYNCGSLRLCTPIDLSECTQLSRIFRLQSVTRLPFVNVNCDLYFGQNIGSSDGSLCDKVTESEWARWFTEDLMTVSNKTLYLGDNLATLSDSTKKIATDKGWILA